MTARPDVLVAFASRHGQTAKIAGRIADTLNADGVRAVPFDLERGGDIDPRDYDAVIVGGSLHAGHHQRSVGEWVEHHRSAIELRPNAFFSVSLTAADDSDEARAATRTCIDEFVEDTAWTPDVAASFAGALMYGDYDVFTRVLMRLIAAHHGGPTDTSHDHELTDWDAVERFARDFARRSARVPAAR